MTKINITLPVYNEEKCLKKTVLKVISFLKENKFNCPYEIVIADNASIDETPKIGKELQNEFKSVKYSRLEQKGRGRALKQIWLSSDCDIVSYMDIDLSTDLNKFPELIDAITKKDYDLSTGCRLGKNSKIIGRSTTREILSQGYNLLLRLVFLNGIKDAQCGFKAIKRSVFLELVNHLENNNWFFDTEMLLWADKKKKKIAQVDVTWTDDPDTRVKIAKTIIEDLEGIAKIKAKFICYSLNRIFWSQ